MSDLKSDPLLAVAKVILALGVALFVLVMAMVLIGTGAVLTVQRAEIYAELAQAGAPDGAYWAVVAALVLIGGLTLLGLRFVLELRNIMRSVDHGDPFEPANADRLMRMGWLALGIQAGQLVVALIGAGFGRYADALGEPSINAGIADLNVDMDGSASLTGASLALVLFILARVFRHGAAMREDLEGTV